MRTLIIILLCGYILTRPADQPLAVQTPDDIIYLDRIGTQWAITFEESDDVILLYSYKDGLDSIQNISMK